MKLNNLHAILNSALLMGIIVAGIIYFSDDKQSMTYVDNIQLFNGFNMTKDIKLIEEKKMNHKAKQLDSLYKMLQLEKNQKSNQSKRLVMEINNQRDELQGIQENYKNNLSQDVWNRLNSYIAEYSENHEIEIVFGTNGNGNVMYAEKGIDITNEILEFSNNKYEGK